jgi:hypothetical protein
MSDRLPVRDDSVPWDKILLTVGIIGGLSVLADSSTGSGAKIKRIEFE